MSAAIVKQALELVDSDFSPKENNRKSKSNIWIEKYQKNGNKVGKGNRPGLSVDKRYTVQDAKKKFKSKKQLLKENLSKLELIKKHSTVKLDEHSTKNIIQRAVSRRPIKTEKKKPKESKTAFTEEDFRKFEEEYLASED